MCELDVAGLNLIDRSATNDNPGYNVLEEFRRHKITIWMNHMGYLVIAATLDDAYCYWVSLTKVNEKEKNSAIFDYISSVNEGNTNNLVTFYGRADVGRFLETKSLDFLKGDDGKIDLSKWYEATFTLSVEDGKIEMIYGYCYVDRQTGNPGYFMAGNVIDLFKRLRSKCIYREASGVYEKVLDNYIKLLKRNMDDPMYYVEIEALINIIDDESYMFVSPNDRLRRKYIEVAKLEYMRYCSHMTAIR